MRTTLSLTTSLILKICSSYIVKLGKDNVPTFTNGKNAMSISHSVINYKIVAAIFAGLGYKQFENLGC